MTTNISATDEGSEQGPRRVHFDGRRFRNYEETPTPSLAMGMRMLRERSPRPWDRWRETGQHPPPPERVGVGDLRVTFVNHSTVLVQMDGVSILTDPIWSKRASPVGFAGPRRRYAPGLPFDALPHIDVVLVSHDHYDHLDLDTLERLVEVHDPEILVGLGLRATLERRGITRVQELDWDDEVEVAGLRVVAQRARHFSGRGLGDRCRTLWLAFVVEGPSGRVYFAGDSGWGSHFAETGARFGPFRLALLPIGAYLPRWFMSPFHIDPDEAVLAHCALRAETSLAIHHGTFRLSQEGQDDPPRALAVAREVAGLPEEAFLVLEPGEGRDIMGTEQASEACA